MKVCIVQPPYSVDYSQSEEYFKWEIEAFDKCDESMDLIVFPESSATPCMAHSKKELELSYERFFGPLIKKARETAKRCNAVVFFNSHDKRDKGFYNTTFAINRDGELVGKYDKQHLTPGEVEKFGIVSDYTYEHSTPTLIEIDGIRYCFLTCYDFYFYEAFPTIARMKPDIIIGCSHQRSDMQSALNTMNSFCAYNCNAYVVRASVSMAEESDIGGGSCVVAPDGKILLDMKSRIGIETVDIDPNKKYYKPAGFGNPPAAHYEYIEAGRRPWKYRPAGPSIAQFDSIMKYPRICAHRGFSTIAPENSMPAFGAAVALGAQEIEFDLWPTKDGEIVSCHDCTLERVSTGESKIFEHTLEELKKLDFGIKFGEKFKGLKIVLFEDILKKFAGQVIMNVHIKPLSFEEEYPKEAMEKIVALVRKYDCQRHVYFMLEPDLHIKQFKEYAPDIPICVGHDFNRNWEIVNRAIALGAQKVQFFKPYFNKEMIDKAHKHGIICNVFWSDDVSEAKEFLKMGMDTVLTNDYNLVSKAIEE